MLEFIRLNLKAFVSEEEAVASLEYAVLAVVILGAVVYFLSTTGSLKDLFGSMASTISSAANVTPKIS